MPDFSVDSSLLTKILLSGPLSISGGIEFHEIRVYIPRQMLNLLNSIFDYKNKGVK